MLPGVLFTFSSHDIHVLWSVCLLFDITFSCKHMILRA